MGVECALVGYPDIKARESIVVIMLMLILLLRPAVSRKKQMKNYHAM